MPISSDGVITAKKPDPKTLLADMKKEVRAVIQKYASTAQELTSKSSDPHTPIISAMQIALANASAEYLITCGMTATEAAQATINVTGLGMKTWIDTVMRLYKMHAKVTTDTVEINDGKKPTVN